MDGGIDWERSDEFSICSDYNCSCPDSSMRARAGTVEGGRGRTYRMVLMWQLPHTLWHNYRKNEWLQGCNQNSCHFYNIRQCWALPWGLLLSRGIASGWIAMMWLSNDGEEGRREMNVLKEQRKIAIAAMRAGRGGSGFCSRWHTKCTIASDDNDKTKEVHFSPFLFITLSCASNWNSND